ncbi:DNA repair protein RecO [Marivita sp. XM-24bin2]|uniref:DNA repair protein RecO n=1 Tax=unclassified Marivita TaxID=2632480 RepID=UPI000D7B406A|nr:DNA repair protein RecO [Marivita sp. XM-24bin2]MCR9108111.1 DNA repair protein RecO [Paracoccaceae bacterium]PWL37031.1 MAG: DNA repair protein RecO [Marivita sp. XM-24bin2]
MDWRDTGILLSARRHGESAMIIDVFTPERGRHAGVVRGGASRKVSPILQPGAQLDLVWRARLEDHLGSFSVELQRSRAAIAMQNRITLAGMNAALSLLACLLPEREAHTDLYRQTQNLLDLLDQSELWPLAYLRWETALLEDLGYGLDLTCCAVTGSFEDLMYISPKSGRAVSTKGAGQWADRLLPLPAALKGEGEANNPDIAEALGATGYFLENKVAAQQIGRPLPQARARFVDLLSRKPQNETSRSA